jgi:hypothetical protein
MNKKIVFILSLFVILSCAQNKSAEFNLPVQIDLSKTRYFPPVGNQGDIGACDWFAAVYYQMTYLYNRQYNRAASPENTFSPKFGYNILNNAGKFPYNIRLDDVYSFVQKHGSATMSSCVYDMAQGTGYKEWCAKAEIWENALQYRIQGYEFYTLNNSAPGANYSFDNFDEYFLEIKKLLAGGDVLVIQSDTNPEYCDYKLVADDRGTEEDDAFVGEHIMLKGTNGPDHTMAVVGFNDNIWIDANDDGKVQKHEKGALKIADSFGIGLIPNRNDGFFWMPYCIVESSFFQHRVNRMIVRNNYHPEIICKITLNACRRDKMRFQFGWSPLNNREAIAENNSLVFDPCGLGYKAGTAGVSLIEGGTFAFDGGENPCDGSFAFDLTDINKHAGEGFYYLRIGNGSDRPLIIKAFEITDTKTGKTIADTGLPLTLVNAEEYRFLKLNP